MRGGERRGKGPFRKLLARVVRTSLLLQTGYLWEPFARPAKRQCPSRNQSARRMSSALSRGAHAERDIVTDVTGVVVLCFVAHTLA